MTPLEIIDSWIDHAWKRGLFQGPDGMPRRQWFWAIRDLIQGLHVTTARAEGAIEYLTKHCRPSDQREALVGCLRAIKEDKTK